MHHRHRRPRRGEGVPPGHRACDRYQHRESVGTNANAVQALQRRGWPRRREPCRLGKLIDECRKGLKGRCSGRGLEAVPPSYPESSGEVEGEFALYIRRDHSSELQRRTGSTTSAALGRTPRKEDQEGYRPRTRPLLARLRETANDDEAAAAVRNSETDWTTSETGNQTPCASTRSENVGSR